MPRTCPICLTADVPEQRGSGDWTGFDCPNCGRFRMSDTLLEMGGVPRSESRRARAVIAFAVRAMDKSGGGPMLTAQVASAIVEADRLPRPGEQMDLMLNVLAERQSSPGERVTVSLERDRALIGAGSNEDVAWTLSALAEQGLIQADHGLGPVQMANLTIRGWLRVEELRRGSSGGRTAFMAMQYGEPELDGLYEGTLRPAVARTGFELVRLNEPAPAGLIDVRMRAELRRARFVLADLTHRNAGAYWEAGFAEGLGKPVVYLCEKTIFESRRTHFDTNHSQHVLWDAHAPGECGEELVATIRATLPGEAKMDA